jgi:hypothetical protein
MRTTIRRRTLCTSVNPVASDRIRLEHGAPFPAKLLRVFVASDSPGFVYGRDARYETS